MALVGVLLAIAAAGWAMLRESRAGSPADRPPLGLFTSLPIVWGEAPDIATMLKSPAPPHWAKLELENRYRLTALDTLSPPQNMLLLLVAQPRALSPDENISLDNWVRGGGRVLVLADPMLTWESSFALGDRRRPQDTVLLSPILARWGLSLNFAEDQPLGEHDIAGVPVNLPGTLTLRPGGYAARCTIGEGALIADCMVGRGRALIVADAALLEPGADENDHAKAFEMLLDRAFAD